MERPQLFDGLPVSPTLRAAPLTTPRYEYSFAPFDWNEPGGNVTLLVPIPRVTVSVKGLMPLLDAPSLKFPKMSNLPSDIWARAEKASKAIMDCTTVWKYEYTVS